MKILPVHGRCWPRRRLWASFPFLEASLWYVGISFSFGLLSPGESLVSAMAAPWRRSSVGSIACEDTVGVSVLWFSGACRWSGWILMGAMHDDAGESKTMAFSGPIESRHPLAVSF